MAKINLNDDSAVVIIGSGAGGGTLSNELCQKGIKVVLLEAGNRESAASFQNNEWGSFGQISWLDKRTTSGSWRVARDFSGLPAWICKTVGGRIIGARRVGDGCGALGCNPAFGLLPRGYPIRLWRCADTNPADAGRDCDDLRRSGTMAHHIHERSAFGLR